MTLKGIPIAKQVVVDVEVDIYSGKSLGEEVAAGSLQQQSKKWRLQLMQFSWNDDMKQKKQSAMILGFVLLKF